MPKRKDADQIISAIVRYLATGEEPKLSGVAGAYMEGIMPALERSKERAESGRRGGKAKALANGVANEVANTVANGVANDEAKGVANRNRNRNKERTLRDLGESINQDSPKSCPSSSENELYNVPQYEHIIRFLNHCSGHTYKTTTRKTRDLIKARYNEGFTFNDFISVIQFKCNQWKYIPKMSGYMRPETLFGTKFESYLQESKAVNRGAFDEYDRH